MKTIKTIIKYFALLTVMVLCISPLGKVFGSGWFFGFIIIMMLGMWGFMYLMYKEDKARKILKEGKK